MTLLEFATTTTRTRLIPSRFGERCLQLRVFGCQQVALQLLHRWRNDPYRQYLLDTLFSSLSLEEGGRLVATFSGILLSVELGRVLHTLGSLGLNDVAQALSSRGIREAMLVPYGQLGALPLSAVQVNLSDGRKSRLGDLFTLNTAPSAHAEEIAHQRAAHLDYSTRPLLLLASNPQPLPHGLASLPFSDAETDTVRRVALRFGRARYTISHLRAQEVTKKRVVQSLEQAWYAHFALHGEYRWNMPLRSRIILAGTEDIPEQERSLFLGEVLERQVNLVGLRLMVVSGCESAVIDTLRLADEMLSLSTGFLQAGAAGVIGALWPVDDRATYLLMSRFAQLYLDPNGGLAPTDALALAQRWLREEATYRVLANYDPTSFSSGEPPELGRSALRNQRYSHQMALAEIRANAKRHDPDALPYADPFYWAAFVLVGC